MPLPLNVVHRMKTSSRTSKVFTVVLAIAFWALFVIMSCLLVSDKGQIDELAKSRDAAVAEQKQLKIEIDGCRQEKQEVNTKLEVSEGAQRAAEQSRHALAGELAQTAQDLDATATELKDVKAQLHQSEQDWDEVLREMKAAEARQTAHEGFVAQLEAQVTAQKDAVAQLETAKAQLKKQEDAVAQLKAARAQLSGITEDRDSTVTQLKDTKTQLSQSNQERNALDSELRDTQAQLQEKETAVAQLEAANTQLRQETVVAQLELEEAKAQLEEAKTQMTFNREVAWNDLNKVKDQLTLQRRNQWEAKNHGRTARRGARRARSLSEPKRTLDYLMFAM